MPYFLVPFLGQVVGDVVPVTERLDALPSGIGLTLVTDEELLKISTAIFTTLLHVPNTHFGQIDDAIERDNGL